MAESEENFEVEEIVNHRYRKGKIQYLIRWKNYGAEDDTWEPHENLDCPEKISAYDKKVKFNACTYLPYSKIYITNHMPVFTLLIT